MFVPGVGLGLDTCPVLAVAIPTRLNHAAEPHPVNTAHDRGERSQRWARSSPPSRGHWRWDARSAPTRGAAWRCGKPIHWGRIGPSLRAPQRASFKTCRFSTEFLSALASASSQPKGRQDDVPAGRVAPPTSLLPFEDGLSVAGGGPFPSQTFSSRCITKRQASVRCVPWSANFSQKRKRRPAVVARLLRARKPLSSPPFICEKNVPM